MTDRLRAVALIVAAGACAAMVGWLGARMIGQLEELRSAPRDNVQWSLSQIEVDLLQFRDALLRLRAGEAPEAHARRRFDLLYSRFDTISRGQAFAALRAAPATAADLGALSAFVAAAARVIDEPGASLTAAAPGMIEDAGRAHEAARRLVLEGVSLFARLSDERRLRTIDALTAAFGVAVTLIAALGVTLAVANRQRTIVARRAAEIARSRARLAATVDASHDAIVAVDGKGLLRGFNLAAEQVFGRAAAQALGVEAFSLMAPPGRRPALRRALRRCVARMQDGRPVRARIETEAQRPGGRVFPAEISIAGTLDEQGRPLIVGTIRDISERLAAEASLRAGRDAALAADRAKSRLLAVMSHEMRTPLNGVMGVLDLLKETSLDARQERFLRIAQTSGEILRRRIDEALDIARLEKGALRLTPEPFDPASILEEVAELTRAASAVGLNTLSVDVDPRLEPVVGDPHRVQQVLLNLAGNAAKFTRRGVIRLEARLVAGTAQTQDVEFAVRDSGMGVPPDEQRRIFEDFVTLDPGGDGSGAGLGLAICRRLVSAMGGEIGVDSAPGLGSRFWFRLPMPRVGDAPLPAGMGHAFGGGQAADATAPPPLRPLDVLVAEDNATSRFVLREMLENAGHRPVMAVDGAEAVRLAAERRFDVILMDVSMPVMNGVAAASAIRAAAGDAAPPIMTLTAHALPEERERFAAAGMIEGPTKPVRRAALLEALATVMNGAGQPAAAIVNAVTDDGEADEADEADEETEIDAIDAEALDDLRQAIGDAACADTIARFLGDLDEDLAALAGAAAGADDADLAEIAHRFGGGCGLVGAAALRDALLAVEIAARADRSLAARAAARLAPDLAAAVRAALEDIQTELLSVETATAPV